MQITEKKDCKNTITRSANKKKNQHIIICWSTRKSTVCKLERSIFYNYLHHPAKSILTEACGLSIENDLDDSHKVLWFFFKSKIYIYKINRLIVWIKFLRKVSPSLSFKYFLNISRAILFCIYWLSQWIWLTHFVWVIFFWVRDSYWNSNVILLSQTTIEINFIQFTSNMYVSVVIKVLDVLSLFRINQVFFN